MAIDQIYIITKGENNEYFYSYYFESKPLAESFLEHFVPDPETRKEFHIMELNQSTWIGQR